MQPDESASENLTPPEPAASPDAQPRVPPGSDRRAASPTDPVAGTRGEAAAAKQQPLRRRIRTRPRTASPPTKSAPYQRQLPWMDRGMLWLGEAVAIWRRGMQWVRSQLPRPWQAKLPDEILTAILLGLVVLLLVLWHPLGSSRPATVAMASQPETLEQVASEASETAPEVSPEQSLIADIQEQVAEVTQSYAAGLIQSVQANFQQGSLQVDLGPQWYDLSRDQQNQLAQDLYGRAQELSFNRLALFDSTETLVARSPVVGSTMVILQRFLNAA